MKFCYQVWISSSRNFGFIWPFFWKMRQIENQLQGLFYCRHRPMYVLRTSVKHLCKYGHIPEDTKMSSKLHWPKILPVIHDRWRWIYIFTFASFDHFGRGKWVGGRSWERELEGGEDPRSNDIVPLSPPTCAAQGILSSPELLWVCWALHGCLTSALKRVLYWPVRGNLMK